MQLLGYHLSFFPASLSNQQFYNGASAQKVKKKF